MQSLENARTLPTVVWRRVAVVRRQEVGFWGFAALRVAKSNRINQFFDISQNGTRTSDSVIDTLRPLPLTARLL